MRDAGDPAETLDSTCVARSTWFHLVVPALHSSKHLGQEMAGQGPAGALKGTQGLLARQKAPGRSEAPAESLLPCIL